MKFWPPKPGNTLITSTRSSSREHRRERLDRRVRVQRHADDLHARVAERADRRARAGVAADDLASGTSARARPAAREARRVARRVRDHQVHVERHRRARPSIASTTGGPIVRFGTKCPSITSTCSQSAPARLDAAHLLGEAREVARQERGRDRIARRSVIGGDRERGSCARRSDSASARRTVRRADCRTDRGRPAGRASRVDLFASAAMPGQNACPRAARARRRRRSRRGRSGRRGRRARSPRRSRRRRRPCSPGTPRRPRADGLGAGAEALPSRTRPSGRSTRPSSRARDLARVERARLRADVEAHPARPGSSAPHAIGVRVGGEARPRDDVVDRQEELHALAPSPSRAPRGTSRAGRPRTSDLPIAWPCAVRNVYAIPPPMRSASHPVEQVVDHRQLVGDLRAAEDRDERPLGLLEHAREGLDLALASGSPAADGRSRATPRHRRVVAVRRAEGVVDEDVAEARERRGERRRRPSSRPRGSARSRAARSCPSGAVAIARLDLRADALVELQHRACRAAPAGACRPASSAHRLDDLALRAGRGGVSSTGLPPRSRIARIVGSAARMRVSSVIDAVRRPAGTLKSTRTSTRLPASARSSRRGRAASFIGGGQRLRSGLRGFARRACARRASGRRRGSSSPTRCRTRRRP